MLSQRYPAPQSPFTRRRETEHWANGGYHRVLLLLAIRRNPRATCLSKRATAFGVITIGASWPVALRSAIRLM